MSMTRQAGIILPGYNPLLVANAPTIGTATAGTAQCASVAFTAPSCTGGSVITTYTAFCNTPFCCCSTLFRFGGRSRVASKKITNGLHIYLGGRFFLIPILATHTKWRIPSCMRL